MRPNWFILALVLLGLAATWVGLHRPGAGSGRTFASWQEGIVAERPDAVSGAREAFLRDPQANLPALIEMSQAPAWPLRSAACQIAAATGEERFVPMLIVRASDSDWHVRAAAFAGLWRYLPLPQAQPLQNTPLSQREPLLLAWLKQHDERTAPKLSGQLCEIYADAGHVELGRPVVDACLRCHAGPKPATWEDDARCAQCHPQVVEQWASTAHAQSLSHLHIASVDESTRQPTTVQFGAIRGLSCAACHPSDGATSAASAPATASTTATSGCAMGYRKADVESCRTCHEEAYAQWQTWRASAHPVRADWPPTQIEVRTDDQRNCVDCHMPSVALAQGNAPAEHLWPARRSVAVLASGLDVQAAMRDKGRKMNLTVTNLSGHAYPTGSRRRALQLRVGPQADAMKAMETFRPMGVGVLGQPDCMPLAPGQQRSFTLDVSIGQTPQWLLRYYRDMEDPNALQVDVLTGEPTR